MQEKSRLRAVVVPWKGIGCPPAVPGLTGTKKEAASLRQPLYIKENQLLIEQVADAKLHLPARENTGVIGITVDQWHLVGSV